MYTKNVVLNIKIMRTENKTVPCSGFEIIRGNIFKLQLRIYF